ncbi:MAG: YlxR family protein [Acutalibacteraceae bacterium]|nr:YlxR family protein [Acutalibacteraceae bacterium]
MSAKKTPLRMCIGCRQMKPKTELVRIVKTPDGKIVIDKTNKLSGRGAYICKSGDCLKKAEKTNALAHTFSTAVDKEIYSCLCKERDSVE